MHSTREANSNETNLPNASSADTTKAPKVKLTKEQTQAQKLLKQILKALKVSPTKKAFSISKGEKQTWKDAINEKLKELKEKEQILSTNKEQPSANSRGVNEGADGAHSEANLGKRGGTSTHANLDENSANLSANEANLRSTRGTNSNEANLRAQKEAHPKET